LELRLLPWPFIEFLRNKSVVEVSYQIAQPATPRSAFANINIRHASLVVEVSCQIAQPATPRSAFANINIRHASLVVEVPGIEPGSSSYHPSLLRA
jgi:hypothetical protein